ncbi:MAG: type II CRISPR-associated endonuclease Cas1 [bacterium]
MTDRMIDLSDTPARLNVRGELLVITLGEDDCSAPAPSRVASSSQNKSGDQSQRSISESPPPPSHKSRKRHWQSPPGADRTEVTVPLSEIAAVIASHPRVTFTRAAAAGLANAGAALIVCDDLRLPAAMLLPLQGHFTQAERFTIQAAAPLPLRKQLWKQIVAAKIRAQGRLLEEIRGNNAGLTAMAARVRSGDPENLEAQAARRYWQLLFDDPGFVRDRAAGGPNNLLNYGYAVLRAVVVRAVCASGLHPSLGLHHSNRYDTFRLASDLMEPFRTIVDRAVVLYCESMGWDTPLDADAKAELLDVLAKKYELDGEMRSLFDIASRAASSLAAVLAGKRKKMILPEI